MLYCYKNISMRNFEMKGGMDDNATRKRSINARMILFFFSAHTIIQKLSALT